MKRMCIVAAMVMASLVLGLRHPQAAQAEPNAWVRDLTVDEKREAAIQALVRMGPRAVPYLAEAARDGSIEQRGWAIVCLGRVGTKKSRGTLEVLLASSTPLVSTWAAAALLDSSRTMDELVAEVPLVNRFPATLRTFEKRFVGLWPQDAGASSLDALLAKLQSNPALTARLAPVMASLGPGPLLDATLGSPNSGYRMMAARFLAATLQAPGGHRDVVLARYAFDPQAKRVPWAGGALYVPGIRWEKEESVRLARHLLAWLLWSDLHSEPSELAKAANNLRVLWRPLNWPAPGRNDSAISWLTAYQRAAGPSKLRSLLKEQNALRDERYSALVR